MQRQVLQRNDQMIEVCVVQWGGPARHATVKLLLSELLRGTAATEELHDPQSGATRNFFRKHEAIAAETSHLADFQWASNYLQVRGGLLRGRPEKHHWGGGIRPPEGRQA